MTSWLPSYPYPSSQAGYWDPVTSTLDWCEENYYLTIYSAEVVNSFTNLMFLYLGYRGLRSCLTEGHDSIFVISFLGYLLVGTGSFCFHSTLKYPMQLVDELSMIYTTCIMFYATFAYGRSTQYSIILGLVLLALCAFITGYYHYIKDPLFHQNAYALLTAIVLFRSIYIMEVSIRPRVRQKERELQARLAEAAASGTAPEKGDIEDRDEQSRTDKRDVQILRTMWAMVAYGLTSFLGGFAIWNLDNFFCTQLRGWRRGVGLPWGILFEGHGWWHLMTGIGAYFYITWGIWLRHCLNGEQDGYELVWPRMVTSFPEVVRRRRPAGRLNGTGNGRLGDGGQHLRKKSS